MNKKVYLDYSATTMIDSKVLEAFNKASKNYYENPNSNHDAGIEANKLISEAIKNICNYFNIKDDEIIFTSGASESNNTVFKSLIGSKRKEIITTNLEHSSIYGPISYLQENGFIIHFVEINDKGIVDLKSLKSLINENTALVSIGAVNSEIGIRQPIEEIGKLLKKYKDVLFHSDITQCLGKTKIDLTNVDLASFSGHKLYAPKGIGGLIKKRKVNLIPLIHGGKSTTIYRSGTPQTELIISLSESFNLFNNTLEEKYKYIESLNKKIKKHISKYKNISINSNEHSIPHILNISFLGKSSDIIQNYFNSNNIYISTQTACSINEDYSKTVYNLTKDMNKAKASIRISLSYKTTNKEIDILLKKIDYLMEHYNEII